MKFIIVHNNGTLSKLSGGCYGCIGRTDSYEPKEAVFSEVQDINESNGYDKGTSDVPYWRSNRSPAVTLRLPHDFVQNGGTFHTNNRPLMEYLVERSPWAECFTQTVQEIMTDEHVDLKAQGVSSELVISVGYILRSMDSSQFSLNWKLIRAAAPEVPELVSMFLCHGMGDLYRTSLNLSLGSGDGSLFPWNSSPAKILGLEEPCLSGLDIQTVGGYVMNVSSMWERGSAGDILTDCINKHKVRSRIQGLFGSYDYSGIQDIRTFILDFHQQLQEQV